MPTAIVIKNLVKRFPQMKAFRDLLLHPLKNHWITALNGVSLEVKTGEIFGLLGPNGAGKTTLIKILCTLILPTEGKAYVNGFNVVEEPHRVKRDIGYCMGAERSFYWRLTGRENLIFFATLNNIPSAAAKNRVGELLELLELKQVADRPFMSYSTGMQQKLGLARALINDPDIFFMDEPTKGLDPHAAQIIHQFIREKMIEDLGKTVFLATHNLSEAEALCHRVAIMDKGEIKFCGTIEEIKLMYKEDNLSDVFNQVIGIY